MLSAKLSTTLQRWLGPLQRKLIFYPVAPSHLAYARWQANAFNLEVDTLTLQGWHLENPAHPETAVLYFGGNAEDVAHSLDFLAGLPVRHVFAFNYRGYGLSQGAPSEANLFADAVSLQRQLQQQFSLPHGAFHLIGRSLGSAVATHLATRSHPATVTLITPLHSVEAISSDMFSWLPVSALLADKFRLLENARTLDAPLLAIIAERDEVIPNHHSLALYNAWKGPKQQLLVPQADHNSVTNPAECLATIARFLSAANTR